MSKIKICVYTNMNNIENMQYISAIKDRNLVKYKDNFDLFVVDYIHKTITKESDNVRIKIIFDENRCYVYVKSMKNEYIKDIDTIDIYSNEREFYVKYNIIDDNIVNEYKVEIV